MLYASGHEQTVELVDNTLRQLEAPVAALFSRLDRTAAGTREATVIDDAMRGW